MRNLNEDNIKRAVIAIHAHAKDARVQALMTSLMHFRLVLNPVAAPAPARAAAHAREVSA